MSNSIAFFAGRFLARNPALVAVATVCLVAAAVLLLGGQNSEPKATQQIAKAIATQAKDTAQTVCERERSAMLVQYNEHMAAGQPWKAATTLRRCANTLQNAEMTALVASAERLDAITTARDPKATPHDRQRALNRLPASDPQDAQEIAKLRKTVAAMVDKADKAEARKIAARKRSEGASIGMSPEDVRASAWGKPEHINRSIYSFGVHEQWVYGDGNYLYFRDGVLSSMQTGR
jgi:hypothetical protein